MALCLPEVSEMEILKEEEEEEEEAAHDVYSPLPLWDGTCVFKTKDWLMDEVYQCLSVR